MTQQNTRQKEAQSNHLATIRGDFLGSISSNTGSRPGYCNGVSEVSVTGNKNTMSNKKESPMLLFKVKFHIKGATPKATSPLLQYFAVFFVEQMPSPGSVQTPLHLKI